MYIHVKTYQEELHILGCEIISLITCYKIVGTLM